jgi:Bacterial antitoxin of type II TA system, VapB
MKVNIEIDTFLLEEAKSFSKIANKNKIIQEALVHYISFLKRKELVGLFGKVEFFV